MRDRCLFCDGDPSEPDHWRHCDGRQGSVEANIPEPDLPHLMSGLTADTLATSTGAAFSVDDTKDTQRERVFVHIQEAGIDGRTDDELQTALGLDGSSERPRRWELWRMDRIAVLHDGEGKAVTRLTRTNRRAVVWIDRALQSAETDRRYA